MKLNSIDKQTSNPYLNLYNLRYDDEVNKKITNYFIASRRKEKDLSVNNPGHDRCDAVMIAPVLPGEKTVFVRQFRPAINDYIYEFPAGLVDDGETIEQAAERELFEETGLKITKVLRVTKPMYTSVGMSDEAVSIVMAAAEGDLTNLNNVGDENIDFVVVDLFNLSDFCRENNVAIKAMLMAEILFAANTINYLTQGIQHSE